MFALERVTCEAWARLHETLHDEEASMETANPNPKPLIIAPLPPHPKREALQAEEAASLPMFLSYPSLLLPCVYLSAALTCSLSLLFSYLTEGCRILQSGWWSSNSIYSAAQRQAARARAIGSGMETADVRECFLLAAERRGRPDRKPA